MKVNFTESEADDRPIEEQWKDYITARLATMSGDMGEMAEESLERDCDEELERMPPNVADSFRRREIHAMLAMMRRPKPEPTRIEMIAGIPVKVYE